MSKHKSHFTKEQEQFIRDNSASMYVQEIADHLGIKYDWVYKYIGRNNLPQKKVQPRKKAEVINGFFNVDAKVNWAI